MRLCDDVNVEEVGGLRGGEDCGFSMWVGFEDFAIVPAFEGDG